MGSLPLPAGAGAANLAGYQAPEPERFVRYHDAMSAGSSAVLAKATTVVP